MRLYHYDPYRDPIRDRRLLEGAAICLALGLLIAGVLLCLGCATTPAKAGLASVQTANIVANDAYQLWVASYNARLPVALASHDTNALAALHAQKTAVREALTTYQAAEDILILGATATTNAVITTSPQLLQSLGALTNVVNAYLH